jgi:putative cofactor-binding repeat protein
VCGFIRRIAGTVTASVVTPQFREWGRMVQFDPERSVVSGCYLASRWRQKLRYIY